MTGRDGMSDAEVRAELERIDPFHVNVYLLYDTLLKERVNPQQIITLRAFRLLAESQRALGEIAEEQPSIWASSKPDPVVMTCPKCEQLIQIARKHWKGAYEGPKSEPILPVSLKCKCGYELKPQDKSCPNCERLFGKKGGSNG